jgi:alpha,alpha-trehalase
MNRRELLLCAASSIVAHNLRAGADDHIGKSLFRSTLSEAKWAEIDAIVQNEWTVDISSATEDSIRKDASGELLFLPFPYVSPTAPGSVYQFMFGWDTDFASRALMLQGKVDQARNHLLNYFFMIDRYGYMPNANSKDLTTRSQTPLVADTTWRYYLATKDRDLLHQAYPRLKHNYREYWTAPHHQTPIGLATNRDLGDPSLAPRLAAEAETGLDWTPIYAGDVRRCAPLITNCALVRYTNTLAKIAQAIGEDGEAKSFCEESRKRASRIRQYCWNEARGFFVEYDYVAGQQLPCLSDCALWTLWSGVATREQAKRLVGHLDRIEQTFGLSCTDKAYPTPSPEADYEPSDQLAPDGISPANDRTATAIGGAAPLQWMFPAGWAPSHVIAVEGLDAYGYTSDAKRITSKFLGLLISQYERTGHLWEKYNVVDGSLDLPNARSGNIWMRGWTAAAVVMLGRRVFRNLFLSMS